MDEPAGRTDAHLAKDASKKTTSKEANTQTCTKKRHSDNMFVYQMLSDYEAGLVERLSRAAVSASARSVCGPSILPPLRICRLDDEQAAFCCR
jgi:hypothetical protein